MTPAGFENYNDILNDIKSRFTNKSLKALCQTANLPVSGNKPHLQQRLQTHLAGLLNGQQTMGFQTMKAVAEMERGFKYGGGVHRPRMPNATQASGYAASSSSQTPNGWGLSSLYTGVPLPTFKRLPFYNILTNVTQAYKLPSAPNSRMSSPIQARLTTEMLAKLSPKGPTNPYRLVLFCTLADRVPYGNSLIEFPTHVEIKCNNNAVTANLRGIKNRPGTVNPADLTERAILMGGVNNKVDIIYQDSKQPYMALVYLVQKFTVDQLVEKVKKRGLISKESTLKRMRDAAQDADLVPGPETLTLKDPISMTRIALPAKSRLCQHTSCFDLSMFFTLNEQTPTWSCPICARAVPTDEEVWIDGYFMDILEKTNKAVESVVIHPDGTWTNKDIDTDHPDAKFLTNNIRPLPQEDRKPAFVTIKPEIVSLDDDDEEPFAPTPSSLAQRSSREPSTSFRNSPSGSTRKRGPPQIVDLTLSDDDDDIVPIRRPTTQQPPQQPPSKRIRLGYTGETPRVSTPQTNGNARLSSIVDRGVPSLNPSQPPAAQQPLQHIRSPPLSISPRNENPPNIFRPNHSPTTLDDPTTTARPVNNNHNTFPISRSPTLHRRPSFGVPAPTPAPQPSLPKPTPAPLRPPVPASPTFTRSYPTPTLPPEQTRERSASPVLPAFSNKPRNNSLRNIDWDNFRFSGTDDEFENPELDLEMARLPSSMFDADGTRDDSDY